MENVLKLFQEKWFINLIVSIVVVIVSLILYKIVTSFVVKHMEGDKIITNKKIKTYVRLVRSICRYVFIIGTILVILQINGINITSILAGVGIFGIVFGLALQDWLKDIIRGTSILSDNYFSVGDVVRYKGNEGKVLILGLKSTKIQDLKTGNILSIANRKIDEIEVVSSLLCVRVPLPYELPLKDAEKVMKEINEEVQKQEFIESCEYVGVSKLDESAILYLLKASCNPLNKLQGERNINWVILSVLEKHDISVPYNQLDIHQKD